MVQRKSHILSFPRSNGNKGAFLKSDVQQQGEVVDDNEGRMHDVPAGDELEDEEYQDIYNDYLDLCDTFLTCFTCGGHGHISPDCPANRCQTCGSRDHKSIFNCPLHQCQNCKENGHMFHKCPKLDRSNVICKKCGQKGHYKTGCQHGDTCFRCGGTGHWARNCPGRLA